MWVDSWVEKGTVRVMCFKVHGEALRVLIEVQGEVVLDRVAGILEEGREYSI